MGKTVLLCHIDKVTLELWESSLRGDFSFAAAGVSSMLANYVTYLNAMNLDVVFALEVENTIAAQLKAGVTGASSTQPYAHEMSLLKKIFSDKDVESVYYLDSIYPVGDATLSLKLREIHEEYAADYSFIENTPPGLTGVYFNRSLFEAMQIETEEQDEKTGIGQSLPDSLPATLREYVEKNINHFHVEIHYEHPDLRLLRLDFSGRTPRSMESSLHVFEKIGPSSDYYLELEKLYRDNPGLLRHRPSYLELEIFGGCEYACTFCARQYAETPAPQAMTPEDINSILSYTQSAYGDTSVALGGQGEPLEHPRACEIINLFLSEKSIPAVILETNGKYLDKIFSVFEHPEIRKLRIVINFNSVINYDKIHGSLPGDRDIVLGNLQKSVEILSKKDKSLPRNIYLQTLKILENEKELDEIYDLADKHGVSFLLQKYNSFAGLMPEKRVSDMTPLERFFCWHLRRDLFIRADGNVAFCKQDVQNRRTRGNIRTAGLEEIWETARNDWENNYRGNYPSEPDCQQCDEYYTFNM